MSHSAPAVPTAAVATTAATAPPISDDVFSDLTALAAQELQSSVRRSQRSREQTQAVPTPIATSTLAVSTAAPELTTINRASPTLVSVSPPRNDPFAGLGEVFGTTADSAMPRERAGAIVV